MDTLLTFIGAFGFGSLVTTIVRSLLDAKQKRSDRLFNLKVESYFRVLASIREAKYNRDLGAIAESIGINRIVGSKKVIELLDMYIDNSDGSGSGDLYLDKVIEAMKKDVVSY